MKLFALLLGCLLGSNAVATAHQHGSMLAPVRGVGGRSLLQEEGDGDIDGADNSKKMGTKILLMTEGRSGSTFLGQILNMHGKVMYFYEPCRSLRWKGFKEPDFQTRAGQQECTKVVRSILDCSFTVDDLNYLLKDASAIKHSTKVQRIIDSLPPNITNGGRHAYISNACKRSIRVVKEIRFNTGVPDNLLYSEVKVLHLVRDVRGVLYSRLQLEAFCPNKRDLRKCIQPLCQSYRATLRCISGYLATLEQRPFWHFYKFRRVKFEEIALDPVPWTQKVYTWAGLGEVPPQVAKWVMENTQAQSSNGPYSTRRNAEKVVAKWQRGLDRLQINQIHQECGDILFQLNYSDARGLLPEWQTTPGSAIGGRVIETKEDSFSLGKTYDQQTVLNHWNGWCGKLSSPIEGYTGRGGHSEDCGLAGEMSFGHCQKLLETSSACSALSYKAGRCFLHDRTASDFVHYKAPSVSASTHVVKMISGVDECLVYDTPLHHARHFYYGEELGLTIADRQQFYLYEDPPFNYTKLVQCYVAEKKIEPWWDERRQEMAQNTGAIWLHEAMKTHPLRTMDPENASLFVVPIEAYVSTALEKPCENTTHQERMDNILQALQSSRWWSRRDGADHLIVCAWWGAAKSWGKWDKSEKLNLWKLMKPRAILATIDEYFARDWNKVLVVPYVAHAFLTRWRKEPLQPYSTENNNNQQSAAVVGYGDSSGGDAASASDSVEIDRNITFFFRGGMLHGVDCKKKGTWVRRAALEAFNGVPGAEIVPTENLEKFSDQDTGLIDASITEAQRRWARIPNYSPHEYVKQLRQSQYCLHLRGDTTTSRRIFDALAAGCVPVLISDGTHLPFKSQINWDAFTVTILEDELIKHKSKIPFAILNDTKLLEKKQAALKEAQENLLYGYGSPFSPSKKFTSKVLDHLLQQAFELVPVVGSYRRFQDTFSQCTLVQTLWPD